MKNKKIMFNTALLVIMNYKMGNYHTFFLANMVVRRLRHPEENLDRIVSKSMKEMHKNYPKKNLLEISAEKALHNLENAIDESEIPENWITGNIVNEVLNNICLIVEKELQQ